MFFLFYVYGLLFICAVFVFGVSFYSLWDDTLYTYVTWGIIVLAGIAAVTSLKMMLYCNSRIRERERAAENTIDDVCNLIKEIAHDSIEHKEL